MSLVGGLGGIFGVAIGATAALVTIDATTRMLRCTQCGYTNPDRNMVIKHARTHRRKTMAATPRRRNTSWVY